MKRSFLPIITRTGLSFLSALLVCLGGIVALPNVAQAYPIYAQQAYDSPREATGRIVCANCHLGAKPTKVEIPQAILPDTVFEAIVEIPYDTDVQQVLGNGELGPLNVGAVIDLPEGFKLAPEERIPEEIKEKTTGLFYQPYKAGEDGTYVIGPISGADHQEIVFPILSPDPKTDPNVHFGKYSVHVGGNRGRGQIQPTGDKTNNAIYTASVAGQITGISAGDSGATVTIAAEDGGTVTETIPNGPQIIVSEGEDIAAGAPLTNDPNVGGFGQKDAEIVLQNPTRIKWLMAFFAAIMISQAMLVLKKKQVEQVQAAEMNF
ncbi:Cytochrome f [Acaryochloris thomasi RCC1774]|uniref:Cytochrome f n=1 Tax=Acaryochloris thomasi RCC1774 TaxID=1764569 RepID=A0A2W1JLJ2_9CYAN|nr:apocytochrome f [Acaryochloris thomasi]PZD74223.1 Cytochrome f [Acaryochloris thomasi RCC1774]